MNTGEKIKQYRKNISMSAEELAEKVGVSPSTIYRYENNDIANMGIDKLKSIASVLNTHAFILLGWDEDSLFSIEYKKIISLLDSLDSDGLDRVQSYAEDLIASGKYSHSRECDKGVVSSTAEQAISAEAKCDRILDDVLGGNKSAL